MIGTYIEFLKEDNDFIAKIHKDRKVMKLKNPNTIKKLIEICHKNKISINQDKITGDNIDSIINEFERYLEKKKNQRRRLQVLGQITTNMKTSKTAKAIAATTLATIIGITSFGIVNSKKKTQADTLSKYEQESILEENLEYVEEEPVIEKDTTYENDPSDDLKYAVDSSYELQNMIESDEYHFDFRDRTDSEYYNNAKRYEDLFEKYGNRYGVDKNLLMAMAAQENGGLHYELLKDDYATGIMQIERKPNVGDTVRAYNFETGKMDAVEVTIENIEDLETNIQIGTIMLRNRLEENNFNIPLALQSYNFGIGNMNKVLTRCSEDKNISKDDLKANVTNPLWLNYRTTINAGDPLYIEHVFSYIPNDTTLTMKTRDGNDITMKLVNDSVNNYQMS